MCYLIGAFIMAQSAAFESVNNAAIDTTVPDPTLLANSESDKHPFIHLFPRHDTMKLDESNYIQWQQHIRLIVEGYELTGFLEGTLTTPPQFV